MTVAWFGHDESQPTGRPAWVRPDSVLPALLTPGLLLARTGDVAVSIPLLCAYPAGFELELVVSVRADLGEQHVWALHPSFPRPAGTGPEQLFRFAVLYSDGQAATNLQQTPADQGLTMMHAGGGYGHRVSGLRYYVQPLPPPGPVTFICEWPAQGIAETRVEIDAEPILDASARAVRLWPDV